MCFILALIIILKIVVFILALVVSSKVVVYVLALVASSMVVVYISALIIISKVTFVRTSHFPLICEMLQTCFEVYFKLLLDIFLVISMFSL